MSALSMALSRQPHVILTRIDLTREGQTMPLKKLKLEHFCGAARDEIVMADIVIYIDDKDKCKVIKSRLSAPHKSAALKNENEFI